MQKGKASLKFENTPFIIETASAVGKMEGEGPLQGRFDITESDDFFGTDSWEKAESAMQKQTAELVLKKSNMAKTDIRYLFDGDLLGQLIATSFGTLELEIPLFGLYGACSTMAEALGLAAMTVNAGYADAVMAMTSSHFATAEKQFRFPLGYGNQRTKSSTRTVTGCGAYIIGNEKHAASGKRDQIVITGMTTGKMVDMGVRDSMNMGAAMATAAFDTIKQNFLDFNVDEKHYDQIVTGDLGMVGSEITKNLLKQEGYHLEDRYTDCGMEIFDAERQDTHSGGSGCGCMASVLSALILPEMIRGRWNRVLVVATGALLSTVSFNEGNSIPGIAHAVVLEKR